MLRILYSSVHQDLILGQLAELNIVGPPTAGLYHNQNLEYLNQVIVKKIVDDFMQNDHTIVNPIQNLSSDISNWFT